MVHAPKRRRASSTAPTPLQGCAYLPAGVCLYSCRGVPISLQGCACIAGSSLHPIPEAEVTRAIEFAHISIAHICRSLNHWREKVGKEKKPFRSTIGGNGNCRCSGPVSHCLQQLGLALSTTRQLASSIGSVPAVAAQYEQWAVGLPPLQCCLVSQQCTPTLIISLAITTYTKKERIKKKKKERKKKEGNNMLGPGKLGCNHMC